jgi:SAM-dependent methyltransferase
MLHEVQRQAAPELTRVFGHTGLYLRPTPALAPGLSGNLLAQVASLHRQGDRFAGDLRCRDGALPFDNASLALVYGLCVLETSPDPAGLLAEISRVLRPEGTALLLTLNPWSPCRLRWAFKGMHPMDPALVVQHVRTAGLEVQQRGYLGPLLAASERVDIDPRRGSALASRLRVASLVVARRRDAAMTPLRMQQAPLKFRPGMSAG